MNSEVSPVARRPRGRPAAGLFGKSRAGGALLFTLPLLAGCASIPSIYEQPADSLFGEANRQTMMAQVIDPDPIHDEPMTTSGDHAAQAIERYRTGTVIQPESTSTTTGVSGGPGGN